MISIPNKYKQQTIKNPNPSNKNTTDKNDNLNDKRRFEKAQNEDNPELSDTEQNLFRTD